MNTARRAIALYATIGIIALIGSGVAVARWASRSPLWRQDGQPLAATPAQARSLLVKLALTPDGLATAGLNPAQASAAVARLRSHYSQLGPALESAELSYRQAFSQREQLRKKIQAGKGTEADRGALTAADAQVVTSASARETARAAVLSDLQEVIGAGPVACLETLRQNQGRGVPPYFRVVTRSESDWKGLRAALSARAIDTRLGEAVPQAVTSVIADAESNEAVAAAKSNLESNGAAVRAAFDAAVAQH